MVISLTYSSATNEHEVTLIFIFKLEELLYVPKLICFSARSFFVIICFFNFCVYLCNSWRIIQVRMKQWFQIRTCAGKAQSRQNLPGK